MTADVLRYPVGVFKASSDHSHRARRSRIQAIATLPDTLDEVLREASEEALDTPYRPGGWTVRQVVHHLADSHINAYVRFRLAVTEDHPTVKPYDQQLWASLPDATTGAVEPSLRILRGVHERWVGFLTALPAEAFRRTVNHPELGSITVDWLLDQYAWHCRHHLGHVRAVLGRSSE